MKALPRHIGSRVTVGYINLMPEKKGYMEKTGILVGVEPNKVIFKADGDGKNDYIPWAGWGASVVSIRKRNAIRQIIYHPIFHFIVLLFILG